MNRFLLLHRIRGPVLLLTFGLTALLAEFHILAYRKSWPLYLIVLGVLSLIERGVLATLPPLPPMAGWGQAYPAPSYPGTQPPPAPGSALVPAADSRGVRVEEQR